MRINGILMNERVVNFTDEVKFVMNVQGRQLEG